MLRTRWAAWKRIVLLLLALVSLTLARESSDLIEEEEDDDSVMEESESIELGESWRRRSKEEIECPPSLDGWMTTYTCRHYYWCSHGTVGSMAYPCPDDMLFDLQMSLCRNKNEMNCGVMASAYLDLPVVTENGVVEDDSSHELNLNATNETQVPTAKPVTTEQPRIYYASFPTQTCLSDNRPSWVTEDHMFRSKVECCRLNFNWVPLQHCTGGDLPTMSPSVSPSASLPPSAWPTEVASAVPSSLPSSLPSLQPSDMPSAMPSMAPSITMLPSSHPSTVPSLSFEPTQPKKLSFAESFASGSGEDATPDETSSTSSTLHSSLWGGRTTTSTLPSDLPMHTDPMEEFAHGNLPTSSTSSTSTSTTSTSTTSTSTFTDAFPSATPNPTTSPTHRPTHRPTESLNGNDGESYIVEIIDHVNTGMDSGSFFPPPPPRTSPPTTSPTPYPTSPPTLRPTSKPVYSITELVIPVAQDATVSEQRPDLNFGSHSSLAVTGLTPNQERYVSLLQFDMSLVDFDRPIDSAIFKIYTVQGCESGGTFRTTSSSDWDSSSVTWNSAPTYSSTDGHVVGTLDQVIGGQWYALDAMSALLWFYEHSTSSNNHNNEQDMTIRIETSGLGRCLYSSRENLEKGSARIIVKYGTPNPTLSPVGSPDAPDIQETPGSSFSQEGESSYFEDPPEPMAAKEPMDTSDTFTGYLQGDFTLLLATDDVTVMANAPNSNFGREKTLMVAFDIYSRGIYDILIRFDLSELQYTLPSSALLSLFTEMECESAGTLMTTEGNGEWNEDTVTWSTSPMFLNRHNQPQEEDSQVFGGSMVGTFGAVRAHRWHGFNVQQALTDALMAGKDAITFKMTSGNLKSCSFTSIEGRRPPKLLVSF